MLRDIGFALWFLLPAALANVTPIFSAVVPGLRRWQTPLDGGRTYRGKALLGSHKTWRGLLSGLIVAGVVFGLQRYAVGHLGWAHTLADDINYAALPLILGPLFGLGALGGDAIESFFKRQADVESGKSWVPFDQLDYIIGGVLVTLPFVILRPAQYLWIFVVWFIGHLAASYAGWLLGLKDSPI